MGFEAMDLLCFLLGFVVVFVCLGIFALGLIYMQCPPKPNLSRSSQEKVFRDPKLEKEIPFASLTDPPSIDLSVIVPAYNEEERLPVMLNEALGFLEERKRATPSYTYEIIIVDDGSKDTTTETGLIYSDKYGTDKVRVLTASRNRGKGGAVRLGMFSARGKHLLFADADGATAFKDIERLEKLLGDKPNAEGAGDECPEMIVCGSRAHLQEAATAERSFFRNILMFAFHFLVWFFCVRGVKDTQCGFKLLTRKAAFRTFCNLHVERWAFDVELLYIAQRLKIPIAEVAVNWQEMEGSKLVPFWSWLEMGRDLMLISLRHMTGAWKIVPEPKIA